MSNLRSHKFGLTCLAAYALIVCVAFAKAFSCGFLADDFVALSEVSNTDILNALLSPWQPTNFQTLYRPLTQLTLMFDHLLYGQAALGYHITNLLTHVAGAVFLALCVRFVANEQGLPQASWLGFAAGLVFSVAPLHCESIMWITGRVDLLATMFFLASFWCFLRAYHNDSRRHRLMLPVVFALAVLSKESAVVLPLVALLYAALLPLNGQSVWERVKLAYLDLKSVLVAIAVVLALRYVILGTVLGGYLGMSDFMPGEVLSRIDVLTLWRLFYPFNNLVVADNGRLADLFRLLYLLLSVRVVLSLSAYTSHPVYLRLLAFGAGAYVLCLLPVAPVAYMSTDALGSRFFYMSSAFLALCLACLIVPVDPTQAARKRFATGFAAMFLLTFTGVRALAASENAGAWLDASRLTERMQARVRSLLSKVPPDGKILYVNPVRQFRGAHVCYNATMLSAILGDQGERVVSLQPRYFWNRDRVSAAQLQQFAQRTDIVASFVDRSSKNQPVVVRNQTEVTCDEPISDFGAVRLHETPVVFRFDAAKVAGAREFVMQISKPNQSFGLFDWRACDREVHMEGTRGTFWLTKFDLLFPGLYELRFAAADEHGRRLEPLSDVLVLKR